MKFEQGNKYAKGGRRAGSGGQLNWLRDACARYLDQYNLVTFLADVGRGAVEKAEIKDRMKAIEMLMDRGFGKPKQEVEVSQYEKKMLLVAPEGRVIAEEHGGSS